MDVDSTPFHAQAPGFCKNTDSENLADNEASEGEHTRKTGMGRHDHQEEGGRLSPLGLDGAAAASCPEVGDPFEIDPQDQEALISLNKELESILDPMVKLHPSHSLLRGLPS